MLPKAVIQEKNEGAIVRYVWFVVILPGKERSALGKGEEFWWQGLPSGWLAFACLFLVVFSRSGYGMATAKHFLEGVLGGQGCPRGWKRDFYSDTHLHGCVRSVVRSIPQIFQPRDYNNRQTLFDKNLCASLCFLNMKTWLNAKAAHLDQDLPLHLHLDRNRIDEVDCA